MKTIITALVATALSFNASASHLHTAACPANCPEMVTAGKTVSKSYEQKVAEMKLAAEDKVSMLHYRQTMQNTLSAVEKQKHQNAIENLEAEKAFNKMMANTLETIEQQKLNDQLEDVEAGYRFEQMMVQTLSKVAGR